jgi:16S rRNA (guanine966-N2)-methyltransferase
MNAKKPRTQTHQIRIIGGEWKRTPLTVITAEGLRPTPDRVRETLFNWLGHLLHANWTTVRALDLFAGSGALGFEAASRGAPEVLMVEAHTPAFRQLEQVQQKLKANQVRLQRGDALTIAQNLIATQQRFDVIFLDPPFNQGYLEKLLPLCRNLLSDGGFLYVEAEQAFVANELWNVIRADKAGAVFFQILQTK